MQVIDRKFYSKYHNDTDFSSDLTDFSVNLAGSVMEEKKVITTVNVDVNIKYVPADYAVLTVDTNSNTLTVSMGGLIAKGFRVGDEIVLSSANTTTSGAVTLKILSLTNTTINYSVVVGTPVSGTDDDFEIRLTSFLSSFLFEYNVIENSDPTNYISSLDGITTKSFYGSIPTAFSTAWVDMIPLSAGVNSSWVNGSARFKWIQNVGLNNQIQQFEIEHTFIIPYYLDGELTNLQTNIPPSALLSSNSYKYISNYKFRTDLTNANSERNFNDDLVLGSVGYFNESFNGFTNNFSVSGLTYTDSSLNPSTGVLEGATTKVSFNIDSAISSFSASTNVGCYTSFLPSITEYQNPSNNFETNFMYDNIHSADGVQAGNTVIQNIAVTYVSVNQLSVVLDVLFNDSRIDNSDYYLIGVEVASDSGTNANSDRAILTVAVDNFEKSADIPNLFDVDRLEFEMYNFSPNTYTYTDIKGWVEDTINVDFDCWLDLGLNAYLNQIDMRIVAYNSTTLQEFDLEKIRIATAGTLVSGTQQYNINTARGFNAPIGNYNNIKFNTGALVGTKQYYNGNVSIKLNWQDWVSLPSADSIFYDTSEQHNGLNKNLSNYSLTDGYEIRVMIDADVEETVLASGTNYVVSSPTIEAYDYDLDDNPVTEYSGVISTFDSIGTNLSQAILTTGDTTIKATFNTIGTIRPLVQYYATISLEPINSTSKNSIKINDAVVSISGLDIIAEYTLPLADINPTTDYKVSSRLYCEVPIYPTPIARLNTVGFIGGTKGTFDFTMELKETDDTTSLVAGDEVTFTLKNGAVTLEQVEGIYGNNISSFNTVLGSPSPASSCIIYMTGMVSDGTSLTFHKKDWADANSRNYANGNFVGGIWNSSAIDLKIEVTATDVSTAYTSTNYDNNVVLEQVVDLIEGNVFASHNGVKESIYDMHDNDSLSSTYLSATVYQKYKGATLVHGTLPTAISDSALSYGLKRTGFVDPSADISGMMTQYMSFTNSMLATNNYTVEASPEDNASIVNNRLITGTNKLETFVQAPKNSVTSVVIERSARVTDFIDYATPTTDVTVYLNTLFHSNQAVATATTETAETAWFNIDMGSIGARNTVKYVTGVTSLNTEIFNQYQIELNYVY